MDQQRNFDSTYAVMDRLPVEFKLKEQEISEKDRAKQFIGIVQNYRNDGRSEAELTEADLTALRALRDGGYDRPGEWAQNLLCFGYGECRPPRTGGAGQGVPKSMHIASGQAATEAPALSTYPNPAVAWANVVYRMKAVPDQAYIAIRDMAGKEMARIPVDRSDGQAVWDTRAVAPGAYTVELVNDGNSLGTVKIIVKQ